MLPLKLDVNSSQDLSCIRKGGPSGLVTVLTALKWWAQGSETHDLWLSAVNDVNICFEALKSGGQKRKESDDGGSTGRGKRRKTG